MDDTFSNGKKAANDRGKNKQMDASMGNGRTPKERESERNMKDEEGRESVKDKDKAKSEKRTVRMNLEPAKSSPQSRSSQKGNSYLLSKWKEEGDEDYNAFKKQRKREEEERRRRIEKEEEEEEEEKEEEEDEEEEEDDDEESQDSPPNGWTREEDWSGNSYFWNAKEGIISLTFPQEMKQEEDQESITSVQRSEDERFGFENSDQHQQPTTDRFGRLLGVNLVRRHLKEILILGDKELLRSNVVRFEETISWKDEEQEEDDYQSINQFHDDDDDDDDDDNYDEDKKAKKELKAAKQLLKEIDFCNYELRWPVFRGYWLLEYFSDAGKVSTNMEKRLRSAMTKFDDKRNSWTQQRTLHQRTEDEDTADELSQHPPQPIDICWHIDRIIERIIKRSQPPEDSKKKKKKTTTKTVGLRTAMHPNQSTYRYYNGKSVHSGGGQLAGKTQYRSKAHQSKDLRPQLSEAEKADINLYKGIRYFLRQQLDAAHQLANRLRSSETRLPLLAMDKQTMAEIRSYGNPKPIVHRVMQASLLLLGYDEEATALWKNCKAACVPDGRNGLNRRLMKFNVSEVEIFILRRASKILREIRLDEIQNASPGAATFYVWALSVLRERRHELGEGEGRAVGGFTRRKETGKLEKRKIIRKEQEIFDRIRKNFNGNVGKPQATPNTNPYHGNICHY